MNLSKLSYEPSKWKVPPSKTLLTTFVLSIVFSNAPVFGACKAVSNSYESPIEYHHSVAGLNIRPSDVQPEIAGIGREYKFKTDSVQSLSKQKKREGITGKSVVSLNFTQSDMTRVTLPDSDYYPSEQVSEKYQNIGNNPFKNPSTYPLSTFSTDVDTASFANVRRFINAGQLPPVQAVRTEEFINYFDYQYSSPIEGRPVALDYELADSPWNPKAKLLKISMQAKRIRAKQGRNLVFLIDVSGSMSSADKLPLLKKSLKLLTKKLTPSDCISIVTYAGQANIVLDATSGAHQLKINQVVDSLNAGGSTNGGNGLALAYELAKANISVGGVNRVLVATDGDFNVGASSPAKMQQFIAGKRSTGISLSVLGFGRGNYNDHLIEALSNAGNGNAAYIDTLQEAKKVLVNQMNETFVTVAYDAKIQVEFNPAVISRYRLLGYENRLLAQEDFDNDNKDAGDIGAGQAVTAIYELFFQRDDQTNLRYRPKIVKKHVLDAELAFVKFRYKQQHNGASKLYQLPVTQQPIYSFRSSSDSFKLAVAAASYAEKLRGSEYLTDFAWNDILELASAAKGKDTYGYRSQFIQQLRLTALISH